MSMLRLTSYHKLSIVCCLLSASVGCGGSKQVIKNRASVSGTVMFEGKPLPAGTIGFHSTERTVTTPATISDGVYYTDRAPLGKNEVTIDTSSVPFGNPSKYVAIPAKYSIPSTSGITARSDRGGCAELIG